MFDTWQELLIAAICILAALLLVTRPIMAYLEKGGKLKAGKVEIGTDCGGVVKEHTDTLARLESDIRAIGENLERLATSTESMLGLIQEIDKTQGPQIVSQSITLQWIRQQLGQSDGKTINGNLDRAIKLIDEAQERYEARRSVGV